jgi:uncharacterized protein
MTTEPAEDGSSKPVLFLAKPSDTGGSPAVKFEWGRNLISFTPALSAANQISAVVVRWGDPDARAGEQNREVRVTWKDVGLPATAMGPRGTRDLADAVGEMEDVLTPDDVHSEADAKRAGTTRLKQLAAGLITGTGSAIGLPALRSGATVQMTALGARFDGIYRLTQTTHTIGGSGYTTTFSARKEVLANA